MAAVSAGDIESWLPAEFLTEEELLMDKKATPEFKPTSLTSFPTEFPYEFDSFSPSPALGSPVESFLADKESSDKDEFLAGLTRRLTQQLAGKPEKQWALAGSPESTLSRTGSWSVSSNGSPNGVLSPPKTPFGVKDDTLELIYAAAGQVARLKMNSEGNNNYCGYQGRGFLGPVKAHNPVHNTVKNQHIVGTCSNHGVYAHNASQRCQHQARQEELLLKAQLSSLWDRQQVKAGWHSQPHQFQLQAYNYQQQQIQSRGRSSSFGCENGRCMRPLGLPQSAWPLHAYQHSNQQHHHLQQVVVPPRHSTSGMRAASLSGSGVKRESTGTGVFLPRRDGNPPETKKKSGCSTVLLPAKVVRALNLNLDDINVKDHTQTRLNNALANDYDILMARKKGLLAQQRHSLLPENMHSHHDTRLPQEWTY